MSDQARPAVMDDIQRELSAMRALADALRGLDATARLRVLRWALAREEAREAGFASPTRPAVKRDPTLPDDGLGIEDLADLFEAQAHEAPTKSVLKRA